MEIRTRINKGIHQDFNEYDQPEGTMRENINGVINNIDGSGYKWRNVKGNVFSFTLGASDKYFSHCLIRERLIVITLNEAETAVKFLEVTFNETIGTVTQLWSGSNSDFNLSRQYPIRVIAGFYENDDIQRIYFSDDHNKPRCINIGKGPFTVSGKFISFTPDLSHVYGRFVLKPEKNDGSVPAGTHFFAWGYYTNDGYYTDWSALSNPVIITGGLQGTATSNFNNYQNLQGLAPDENTGKSINFRIEDIDSDYENIRVCEFYSNDMNISYPGKIIFDGKIAGNSFIDISYRGNESFGSVTIKDLIETSIVLESFGDMVFAKKKNVVARIKERSEIDVRSMNSEGKDSYVSASVSIETKSMLLDMRGMLLPMTSNGEDKALTGVTTASYDAAQKNLYRGMWYKAITEVKWSTADPATVESTKTIAANGVFYIPKTSPDVIHVSGDYIAAIVKKKYRKHGVATTGDETVDMNAAYEKEVITLDNEYQDYKSSKMVHYMKGYPSGEKVRLGVLFFDKTGRPFFVRHLRNTNQATGLADVNIPVRSNTNPLTERFLGTAESGKYSYRQTNALIKYLKVSGIDITDIKDKIGGFMIVRCPIKRQYHGMGLLVPTYLGGSGDGGSANDVYAYPNLCGITNATNFAGCYDFLCPEDMFRLKDFAIQPGDSIENITYLEPFLSNKVSTIKGKIFSGMGNVETSWGNQLYQKFYLEKDTYDGENGKPGISHKVLHCTKYIIGDSKLPVNPLDPTKLYQNFSKGYRTGEVNHIGTPGNHSVLILDIDETSGGMKGRNTATNDPLGLLVALKRPNADPYGGSDDSSLANSVYMSTGHFQEITPAVLASIESNGRYVFDDIEIFGGDTFIGLFDYKRLYHNEDSEIHQIGHTVIFPVESRMNLSLRKGVHVSRNRSYDEIYNKTGMRMAVGSTVLEEFSYNDGFSSDDVHDYYIPVPFNYKLVEKYDMRIRYTTEKNYGETQDRFRRFLANDFIDLDSNRGPITNIKFRHGNMIYWQPDEVGYIPLNERTLTQNSVGEPVQLGVGGLFERYDELITMVGNSNQFGLVESPEGFHWYDAKRKLFVTLDRSMRITEKSVVDGMDSFFRKIPLSFKNSDKPALDYGCHGWYDAMNKMVFYTFFISVSEKYTIGIDVTKNEFVGFYTFHPRSGIEYSENLYLSPDTLLSFFTQGIGAPCNFFEQQHEALVSIIVKEPSNESKIFDTFEMIGNTNLFTKILYETSTQSVEEVVSDYSGGNCQIVNCEYSGYNKRWHGSFPLTSSRERLNDGYVKITFKIDQPYLVAIVELITNFRKQY